MSRQTEFASAPRSGRRTTRKDRLKAKPKGAAGKGERSASTKSKGPSAVAKSALFAGSNSKIAKADGDAPMQAYIAAMPGWKRDVGRRLDALIVRSVPNVRKAVRWNSPFWGTQPAIDLLQTVTETSNIV